MAESWGLPGGLLQERKELLHFWMSCFSLEEPAQAPGPARAHVGQAEVHFLPLKKSSVVPHCQESWPWQVTEESVEGCLEHRLVQALHIQSLSRSKGSIIPAGSEEFIKKAQIFGGGQLGSGLHVRVHVIWLEKRPNRERGSRAFSS